MSYLLILKISEAPLFLKSQSLKFCLFFTNPKESQGPIYFMKLKESQELCVYVCVFFWNFKESQEPILSFFTNLTEFQRLLVSFLLILKNFRGPFCLFSRILNILKGTGWEFFLMNWKESEGSLICFFINEYGKI